MSLCSGELPVRFLCCCSFLMCIFICRCSSFCCWLFFIDFQATLPCHRHSTLASQGREGLHQLWALPQLLLITFSFSSTVSATVFEWACLTNRHFLPYAPSQHFWHNLLLSRLPWESAVIPWSLQGFTLIFETRTRLICLFDSQ